METNRFGTQLPWCFEQRPCRRLFLQGRRLDLTSAFSLNPLKGCFAAIAARAFGHNHVAVIRAPRLEPALRQL